MMKLTVVRFTLELISPLHIGSGSNSADTDAAVVRDAFGDYRIPGSSLAGALRAHCGDTHSAAWGTAGKNSNRASSIEVADGYLIDWDGTTTLAARLKGAVPAFATFTEIQDHVRIDHGTGAAEEGGKFDAEIVPQGTRFRCELSLVERGDEAIACEAFDRALFALANGDIALGGDVCSGLGLVRIVQQSMTRTSFDLSTAAGLTAARNRPSAIDASSSSGASVFECNPPVDAVSNSDRVNGVVTIRFRTDGPLLVGGSQKPNSKETTDKNFGADLVFGEARVADYTKKSLVAKPWIPGSSLRGAIRHRAWHIFEALGGTDSKKSIDDLFGSVDGKNGTASKVRVHGQFLEPQARTHVQHVAIDRLTGGSLKGALYSEAPIWRDDLEISVRVRLDEVSLTDAAVLAHALIDMGTGELPIGGGTQRGNGRLLFADAKNSPAYEGKAIEFNLTHGEKRYTNKTTIAELNAFVDALESANHTLAGARE